MGNLVILLAVWLTGSWALSAEATDKPSSDELRERAAAVKREIAELMEQGRLEEAEKLERLRHELMVESAIARFERQEKALPVVNHASAERVQHLRAAVKHLLAAGMPDLAHEVEQRARRADHEQQHAQREVLASESEMVKQRAMERSIAERKALAEKIPGQPQRPMGPDPVLAEALERLSTHTARFEQHLSELRSELGRVRGELGRLHERVERLQKRVEESQ